MQYQLSFRLQQLLFAAMLTIAVLLINPSHIFAQSYNYQKATEAFKNNNYDEALDYLGRELNDNPKNYEAYFYRALIYKSKEKYSLALTDINVAIKNFSNKEKSWLAASHRLKGELYLVIDEYNKAMDEYATAIKLSPDYIEYYIDRAQVYFEHSEYEKAEADYNQVLQRNEGEVRALAGLGRNHLAQKNHEQAEIILNKLVKLDPEYATGFYYRAILFKEKKEFNKAIDDVFTSYVLDESDKQAKNLFIEYAKKNYSLALSKVNAKIVATPEKDDWYFIRAQLLENKKDFTGAIRDYNKVYDLIDPADRDNLLNYRAGCFSSAGFYDQSITDYSSSLAIDSTEAFCYAYRGDVKRLKGDLNGALDDFNKAIEMEPREDWFYFRRGWIKDVLQHKYADALIDYSDAISINNKSIYTYLHRGRIYLRNAVDSNKAKDDFNTILALDTVITETGNYRQYALFHLGRKKEALEWQQKVLDQYPNETNYYDAACLYSLSNDTAKALTNMQLAFAMGYINFKHITQDDDMVNAMKCKSFASLVAENRKQFFETNKIDTSAGAVKTERSETATIPMKSRGSGTYEVSCKVNDLRLNFIFDTGASDISISQTEALFMLKNEYLNDSDIMGKQNYMDANGNISVGTKVMLRRVEIGGIVLKNVTASVVNNKNAPLLFGQSALNKYGKIIIDNKKSEITITTSISQ